MAKKIVEPSSFRDPNGFLFTEDGVLYRYVHRRYREHYDHLIGSGLYDCLVNAGLLVPHEEVPPQSKQAEDAYRVLKPARIPFISYPYEWCFSQLKDAALATLEAQKTALRFGMCLMDASAYNVQFRGGKPILIDTLSFERRQEGQPWTGYRQFCRHFLAPLALMSHVDVRLGQLLRVHVDGLPLDLASSLLPFRSHLRLGLLAHVHLHARNERRFATTAINPRRYEVSQTQLLGIVDSLESAVRGIPPPRRSSPWADYYSTTNYDQQSFDLKARLVRQYLERADPAPRMVWDLGANTGHFSRIPAGLGIPTVAFEADHACAEINYAESLRRSETTLLPLLMDLTNPSPAIGWATEERSALVNRGPADMALALAIIHHLAISNNLPLGKIADFFAHICRWLVIEFVPKNDSQVQLLLSTRRDIFPDYAEREFEREFGQRFAVRHSHQISDSGRKLYLMERR